MGLFGKLFGEKNPGPRQAGKGNVGISGNRIWVRGSERFSLDGDCEVDRIQRVHVHFSSGKESLLLLNDNAGGGLCIPVSFNGFLATFEQLSLILGFDASFFLENIKAEAGKRYLLWEKILERSYKILEKRMDDCLDGFEVLSPEKNFFSWDITFKELEHAGLAEKLYPDSSILVFKYPVRIGRFLFRDLRTGNDFRKDIALRFFIVECRSENAEKTYMEICDVFSKGMGTNGVFEQFRYSDGEEIQCTVNGMTFIAAFQRDRFDNYEKRFTRFSVHNKREYPRLLENKPYEDIMEASDFLLIENPVEVRVDYKLFDYVKRRPPLLDKLFKGKSLVWRNDANGMIGFADARRSAVFAAENIKAFSLENLIPAKGSGGADLRVQLVGKQRKVDTFSGKYRCMNEYVEKISSITRKTVVIETEYHDA